MNNILSINPRNEDEYLETRVVNQIMWYEKKSITNKKWFLNLKVLEIALSLCIPFLAAYITNSGSPLKVIVGSIGVIIASIEGIMTLVKFQENWFEYRTVAESLKLEKFLYLAKAGPYLDNNQSYSLFVERFESLISNSTKKWINYIAKSEIENKKSQ
jgi:hypothetical protein